MGFQERVEVTIDIATSKGASALKDLKTNVSAADGAFGKMGAAAKGAGGMLAAMPFTVVAAGALAAGAAVIKLGDDFTKSALDAKKLSEASGLNVKAASEWIAAADDVGISTEQITGAFSKATKAIGVAPEKFQALGVSMVVAKDGTIDMNETMLRAVDVLNSIEDPTKKAALASQLFGRSWQELTPLLEEGSGALRDTMEATSDAQRITDEEVVSAKKWQAAMDDLGDVIVDVKMNLGGLIVDGLAPSLKAVGEMARGINDLSTSLGGLVGGGGPLSMAGEATGFWVKNMSPVGASLKTWELGAAGASAATGLLTGALGLNAEADVVVVKQLDEHGTAIQTFSDRASAVSADIKDQAEDAMQFSALAGMAQETQAAAMVATLTAQAEASAETDKAIGELRDSINDLPNAYAAAAGAAEGFSTAFDSQRTAMFGVRQTSADVIEGMGGMVAKLGELNPAIRATGESVNEWTQEGRDLLDNLEAQNQAFGENFEAILAGGGSYDDVRAKASGYRDELVAQFDQLGLTSEEQQSYLTLLGLTPEQVETTIKLSQADEARQKIALLNIDIASLPEEARTEYIAAINQGDYEAALAKLVAVAAPRTAPITATARTADAEAQLNEAARERFTRINVSKVVTEGFAAGGPVSGLALVAEQGAEAAKLPGDKWAYFAKQQLVNFPVGSYVYTAAETRAMMAGGISGPVSAGAGATTSKIRMITGNAPPGVGSTPTGRKAQHSRTPVVSDQARIDALNADYLKDRPLYGDWFATHPGDPGSGSMPAGASASQGPPRVPYHKGGGAGTAVVAPVFNFNGPIVGATKADVGRWVAEALNSYYRNGGQRV